MSTTQTKPKTDRIAVTVPRAGAGDDPNLFVSIGGINYILPRGETSHVPPAVAAELARAERARDRLDRRVRELADGC
jgi:hypothetical protein